MMSNICDIDFGTPNSIVGWLRPDAPTSLPFEDGKVTPSPVILFHAEDPTVSYGRVMPADYPVDYKGRLMCSLKSLFGTSMMDDSIEIMSQTMLFRKLLAHFIGRLKWRAEHATGHGLRRAVLGRPMLFIDRDPKADQLVEDTLADIACDVGFGETAFQYKFIAAAFDYEAGISGEELVFAADIGGGTSDFSLVRPPPDHAKRLDHRDDILANSGVHTGGIDFDCALNLVSAMPLLSLNSMLRNGKAMPSGQYFDLASWHTINHVYTRKAWTVVMDNYQDVADIEKLDRLIHLVRKHVGHWLATQIEAAKIALSDAPAAEIGLHRIAPESKQPVTRKDSDQLIGKLVDKTVSMVQAMLRTAGVVAEKIDIILLADGPSGVSLLREQLVQVLPSVRRVEGDPLGGIGSGLAHDAARKFG